MRGRGPWLKHRRRSLTYHHDWELGRRHALTCGGGDQCGSAADGRRLAAAAATSFFVLACGKTQQRVRTAARCSEIDKSLAESLVAESCPFPNNRQHNKGNSSSHGDPSFQLYWSPGGFQNRPEVRCFSGSGARLRMGLQLSHRRAASSTQRKRLKPPPRTLPPPSPPPHAATRRWTAWSPSWRASGTPLPSAPTASRPASSGCRPTTWGRPSAPTWGTRTCPSLRTRSRVRGGGGVGWGVVCWGARAAGRLAVAVACRAAAAALTGAFWLSQADR
jgi:hypothetical protein